MGFKISFHQFRDASDLDYIKKCKYTSIMKTLIITFCLMLFATAQSAQIDDFSSNSNDRFSNHPDFIGESFNLSGVALTNGGHWVTMISPNVYITANHFKSGAGTVVNFYETNDPNGSSISRSISSTSQRIGNTDLWLGTLNEPLTFDYAYYDFANEVINNNNTAPGGGPTSANAESFINSPYYLENTYMFGRSPSSFPVSQDIAVGRNRFDRWLGSVTAAGATDLAFGADYNASTDTNYVQHETILEQGDSGGPMMVDINGSLRLIGINWFIYSSGGEPLGTAVSYVGNHATEIESFLDTHSLAAIPEPGTLILGLILLGAFGVTARWRNHR